MGRLLARFAFVGALLLMVVNIAGLVHPVAEHSAASQHHVHKNGLVRLSYQQSIAALANLDNSWPAERVLAESNRIIAARIVHVWPDPGESDTQTMHSFLENWFLATLQRGEAWLASRGLTEGHVARMGRRDFREILAKGVGLCGMAAIALVDYLQERDMPAKILVLGGHVVVYASVRGRNYILDPDHGVMIVDVPAPPELSIHRIAAAYHEAGYRPKKVQKLARKYATQMHVYELANFQRGAYRLLLTAELIKWTVPLLLIVLIGLASPKTVSGWRRLIDDRAAKA